MWVSAPNSILGGGGGCEKHRETTEFSLHMKNIGKKADAAVNNSSEGPRGVSSGDVSVAANCCLENYRINRDDEGVRRLIQVFKYLSTHDLRGRWSPSQYSKARDTLDRSPDSHAGISRPPDVKVFGLWEEPV